MKKLRGGQRGERASVYFPLELVDELHREAARQSKTYSHLVQVAWKLAREKIRSFRVADGVGREPPKRSDAA